MFAIREYSWSNIANLVNRSGDRWEKVLSCFYDTGHALERRCSELRKNIEVGNDVGRIEGQVLGCKFQIRISPKLIGNKIIGVCELHAVTEPDETSAILGSFLINDNGDIFPGLDDSEEKINIYHEGVDLLLEAIFTLVLSNTSQPNCTND